MMLRIFSGHCGDFRGQQAHDDAVFISRPRGSIETQERSPCTFFAAKAQATVMQAINEPFEAHRHFHQLAAQISYHAVNHRAGNQRLAYRYV
jgi:hypothetical protein